MHYYFLRHAQSVGNATGNYSTAVHDTLSDLGQQQAHAVVERLQSLAIDHIYCSPLQRAVQTIVPFAEHAGRDVEIWPELAEACWQPDRTPDEHAELELDSCSTYADLSRRLRYRDGHAVRPIEHETYAQGLHRLRLALDLLHERHLDDQAAVLIVGHGFSNARLIEMLLGIEPIGRFDHDNTGISCLVRNSDHVAVKFLNRMHH